MLVSAESPRPAIVDDGAHDTDASPSLSFQQSSVPAADTAGSTRRVEDFDLLPTDSDVPEWAIAGSATLDVAAMPTAMDRSARLTADARGRACRALSDEITSLTADFMVEPLPPQSVSVLTIELAEDSAVTLTVAAEGARLTDSSERIPLESRGWYRWSVSRGDDSYQVALSEVDGAELGRAEVGAPDAAAQRFCISTESPTRIYLDTLTVEGH